MTTSTKFGVLAVAAVIALGVTSLAQSADSARPGAEDGSNVTGTERVCGNGQAKTFAETYTNCKRGDVIGLGRASQAGMMSVCDFTKTILYTQGEAIACVYTGSIRQTIK